MIKRKKKTVNKRKTNKRRNKKQRRSAKWNHLPKNITEQEFLEYFLPHLSTPQRGFTGKIPLYKSFNYILYHLHTGCQWYQVPIETDRETNKPEIHYTNVFKRYAKWCKDGSFERLLVASVKRLNDAGKLDTSAVNGDGTNNVAKKGGRR